MSDEENIHAAIYDIYSGRIIKTMDAPKSQVLLNITEGQSHIETKERVNPDDWHVENTIHREMGTFPAFGIVEIVSK